MKDWNKVFTTDEQNRLSRRLLAKQKNALERGIECTLTMDDMFMLGTKLLGHGKCDYTDLSFSTIIAGTNGDSSHPRYPTIERIDDTKGYVRGNICVVMQRANQLKDNLVDKRTATTIIDPIDREIVKAMMLNMSQAHLDNLKTKYIPQQENEMNTEEIMQGALDNVSVVPSPEHSVDSYVPPEEDDNADLRVVKEAPADEPLNVPDDVAIAKAYAKYCIDFAAVGMNVSVTYAQFKAKYVRKVCALTGVALDKEPKFILILNLQVGFAKDNFLVVGDKIGNAITTMMINTGMSVPKITAMLNKAV